MFLQDGEVEDISRIEEEQTMSNCGADEKCPLVETVGEDQNNFGKVLADDVRDPQSIPDVPSITEHFKYAWSVGDACVVRSSGRLKQHLKRDVVEPEFKSGKSVTVS